MGRFQIKTVYAHVRMPLRGLLRFGSPELKVMGIKAKLYCRLSCMEQFEKRRLGEPRQPEIGGGAFLGEAAQRIAASLRNKSFNS